MTSHLLSFSLHFTIPSSIIAIICFPYKFMLMSAFNCLYLTFGTRDGGGVGGGLEKHKALNKARINWDLRENFPFFYTIIEQV